MGTLIVEYDLVKNTAVLITSIGKSPLDLAGKVKQINGDFYFPMNKLFELLSKNYKINQAEGWVEY